ncbi:MAG: YqeG family HAD IIIA-type phosphatase [Cyanobacteria bacterium HKST-UBA04]|nr:YqeG family HAD IIIA-type phosphatase [Cyanobacteria bacterium HKST-UBA04]MCA9841894.1 YqeG family HAD IIIA-type phosphatase [Cyanobacteria bacterium HKST-UBA03]
MAFLKPTWVVTGVLTIDLDAVQADGVKGFIFDLDNTIMAPNSALLENDIDAWLKKIHALGFKTIVVSNNPLSFYTKKAEEILKIPVIGNAGKPRRRMLRKALELLGLQADQVAVVGDRPLTDIWGGQRLGCKTILVDPLTKTQENRVVQVLRKIERQFIASSHRQVQHPHPHHSQKRDP